MSDQNNFRRKKMPTNECRAESEGMAKRKLVWEIMRAELRRPKRGKGSKAKVLVIEGETGFGSYWVECLKKVISKKFWKIYR